MKTRYRAEHFLPYDEERIIRHLERMAKKGWLLSGINKFFWIYRRIEPCTLKFGVTWCSGMSEYDSAPTEEQQLLWDYCKDGGWMPAAQSGQMQIMYTRDEEWTSLETDEAVRLEMIHQAMKKTYLPAILAGIMLAFISSWRIWVSFMERPFNWLLSDANWILLIALLLIGCHHLLRLSGYYLWYKKSEKCVSCGEPCVKIKRRGFVSGMCSSIGVGLLLWGMVVLVGVRVSLTFLLAAVVLVVFLECLKAVFRKLKIPKEANQIFTVICFTVLFIVAVLGMVKWMVSSDALDSDADRVFTAKDLPLVIEDLREPEADEYFYELQEKESIFYHWLWGYQRLKEPVSTSDFSENILEYRVVDIKIPLAYDLCLASFTDKKVLSGKSDRWQKIKNDDWGLDTMYQYMAEGNQDYTYVFCWEECIVKLKFDWEPTAEQIQIAIKKLVYNQ